MLRLKGRRGAIACLILLHFSGCQAWKNVELVDNPDPETRPGVIELSMKNGGVIEVYYPNVGRDSVRGWLDKDKTRAVSLGVSDVRVARTRTFSSERTAGLVVGSIIASAIVWTLLFINAGGI